VAESTIRVSAVAQPRTEEGDKMVRSAVLHIGHGGAGAQHGGTAWAAAVAILFAAIAFASFAVDLSLGVCAPGAPFSQVGTKPH
jgi:hypothetical protein